MSDILKSVHKTAKGLKEAGAIDKTTMRQFDALCSKVKRYKQSGEKVGAGRKQTQRCCAENAVARGAKRD